MSTWWLHPSLTVTNDQLYFDGHSLRELARQHGTPLYVYSRATIQRQLGLLQSALAELPVASKIYYAMKSNRHPGVLAAVRQVPGVGIDACSPREVSLALEHGFSAPEISFNAGMLSNRDLAFVAERGIHITLDSFSALRRYGALVPRHTPVGLRFNPGINVGYSPDTRFNYSNDKFGFEAAEVEQALQTAQSAGLVVDSVHMHVGWGVQASMAGQVGQAFERLAAVARQIPTLRAVNVGGGLGGQYQADDSPLSLAAWRELLLRHLSPLGATLLCEPGTFVSRPAGVLLVEVNTVEERRGVHWLGVDAGFAINPLPALYGIPLKIVPLHRPLAEPAQTYRVVGHINEVTDVWAAACPLPAVAEGDLLAFLPVGAYSASMGSDHCLRGQAKEIVI